MNESDRRLEELYQTLLRWGNIPEFQAVLREVEPSELVTLLRAAKRLHLVGDQVDVQRRTDQLIAILAAHERWQRRGEDIRSIFKIFTIVGGAMLAIWAWVKDPLAQLVNWWLK